MKTELTLIFIGSLVFLSHFFVNLFERTKIPDVIWLTIIGFVLGPVIGLVGVEDFGQVGYIISKITLVIILFEGGLELRMEELKKHSTAALLLVFVTYLITLAAIWGFLLIIPGIPSTNSLYIAAVLAGPAPSVVIPMLKKLNLKDGIKTAVSLESILGESLCILISLAILESMRSGNSMWTGAALFDFFKDLSISFILAMVLGVIAGYIWSLLLGKMRRVQNSLFTTLAFVFIVYGATESLGFSGPIACLAFGITMGNIRFIASHVLNRQTFGDMKAHTSSEIRFFSEIVFLLKIFFFVYLGLSIQLSHWVLFVTGLALTVIVICSRLISVVSSQKIMNLNNREAWMVSSLFPRGLAAAILASAPMGFGIAQADDIKSIVDYSIIISILISSVMLFWVEKKMPNKQEVEAENEDEITQPNFQT